MLSDFLLENVSAQWGHGNRSSSSARRAVISALDTVLGKLLDSDFGRAGHFVSCFWHGATVRKPLLQ